VFSAAVVRLRLLPKMEMYDPGATGFPLAKIAVHHAVARNGRLEHGGCSESGKVSLQRSP